MINSFGILENKLIYRFGIIGFFIFSLNALTAQKKYREKVYLESQNLCQQGEYQLVWGDEFDGNVLDTSKWIGYYPYGPTHRPDSCSFCRTHVLDNVFLDENISLSNGILRLKSDKTPIEWFGKIYNHTSAMIYSKQHFKDFGKYEIRTKLPKGKQQWPAFWLFGWNTEIDIFEFICKGPSNLVFSVHKWMDENCKSKASKKGKPCYTANTGNVDFGIDFSEEYHTFSMEYEPHLIKFYIDDIMVSFIPRYYYKNGQPVVKCEIEAGTYLTEPAFPIDYQHVHLIANQGICYNHKEKNPIWPNFMEIDYIRVYHKKTNPISLQDNKLNP